MTTNEIIKADLFRYNKLTSIRKGMKIIGFKITYYHRKANHYGKYSLLGWYYRYKLNKTCMKYNIQMHRKMKVGEGFYMGFLGPIAMNKNTIIGKNCNIGHFVTLGQVSKGKYKGSPELGDEVWVGASSVIVGKIKIGNNVLIAPNSFVNRDVPENSLVIGNPAKIIPYKIISKEKSTQGYINNILSCNK